MKTIIYVLLVGTSITCSMNTQAVVSNERGIVQDNLTIDWKRPTDNLKRYSVVNKPKCSGGLELKLTTPKFNNNSIIGELRVNNSPDGKYWVISEQSDLIKTANFQGISKDTLLFEHSTSAQIICYKQKFDTAEMKEGEIVYTHNGRKLILKGDKVIEAQTGKPFTEK